MSTIFNKQLIPKKTGDEKVFYANSIADGVGLKIWRKPSWASYVIMTAIGGGGGGGNAFSNSSGVARGGGAGGASSGISRFMCPALFLPNILYIQTGIGGKGGGVASAGAPGINSYILTNPDAIASPNIILAANTTNPSGGGAGTGGGGGTAGAAPTIALIQPCHAWGQWFTVVGVAGVAGGSHTGAAGTSLNQWGVIPIGGAAGGGGCTTTDFNGGDISIAVTLDIANQGYYITAAPVNSGGRAGSLNGGAGVNRLTPFFCSGGAGGRTNNTGVGGAGGLGGYGCGGGGGGAGTTGGKGGDGGAGIVIITTI